MNVNGFSYTIRTTGEKQERPMKKILKQLHQTFEPQEIVKGQRRTKGSDYSEEIRDLITANSKLRKRWQLTRAPQDKSS